MEVQGSPTFGEETGFRHEALLYSEPAEFLAGALNFIKDAVRAKDPILVVVDEAKINTLREHLGQDSESVLFADMSAVGSNPARIIPAWRDFVNEHGGHGKRLRGIGEPISNGRGPDELVECQHHEALLNLAFADVPSFWLLCPYDTSGLTAEVVDEAQRSHPFVSQNLLPSASPSYRGMEGADAHLGSPLAPPSPAAVEIPFRSGPLREVRHRLHEVVAGSGIPDGKVGDIVLATSELMTNSLRHGGGSGTLLVWEDERSVICEVRDQGRLPHALVDRQRPSSDHEGGRGLWLVNQLCDLLQLRSVPEGTVARAHFRREPLAAAG